MGKKLNSCLKTSKDIGKIVGISAGLGLCATGAYIFGSNIPDVPEYYSQLYSNIKASEFIGIGVSMLSLGFGLYRKYSLKKK